jgi:hypothetical protein
VASLCNYPSSSPSVLIQHLASWIEQGTSASRRYSRSPGLLTAKIDWGDAHAEPVAQILANAVRGARCWRTSQQQPRSPASSTTV